MVVIALCKAARQGSDVPKDVVRRGLRWLLNATDGGRQFSPRPIGLYFARLWYFEVMYPEIWCLEALKRGELFWADGAG